MYTKLGHIKTRHVFRFLNSSPKLLGIEKNRSSPTFLSFEIELIKDAFGALWKDELKGSNERLKIQRSEIKYSERHGEY